MKNGNIGPCASFICHRPQRAILSILFAQTSPTIIMKDRFEMWISPLRPTIVYAGEARYRLRRTGNLFERISAPSGGAILLKTHEDGTTTLKRRLDQTYFTKHNYDSPHGKHWPQGCSIRNEKCPYPLTHSLTSSTSQHRKIQEPPQEIRSW